MTAIVAVVDVCLYLATVRNSFASIGSPLLIIVFSLNHIISVRTMLRSQPSLTYLHYSHVFSVAQALLQYCAVVTQRSEEIASAY